SDPVVVATPDGFHVIFMAFKRGGANYMMDAVFQTTDVPDSPQTHNLKFKKFTTLAFANNATNGQFHDKPSAMAVKTPGSTTSFDVVEAHTLFTGNGTDINFQAHVYVNVLAADGTIKSTTKIYQSTSDVSGTAPAVAKDGTQFLFVRDFSPKTA